jgi:hypothetical protein
MPDGQDGQTISTVLCFASAHKHNHMDSLTIQEVGSHGKSWGRHGKCGTSMVISWGKWMNMDEHGYFD